MKIRFSIIISWILSLWISKVFVTSLLYKFTAHPDTQHIFGTIGSWLGNYLGLGFGHWFTEFGAYVIGGFEMLTSLVLLAPGVFWLLQRFGATSRFPTRRLFHCIGGLMASSVMLGAVFFHLVSPLGIEVIHEGKGDKGSLFYAAVSILVSGIILSVLNRKKPDSV